jgi:hypothetical protein
MRLQWSFVGCVLGMCVLQCFSASAQSTPLPPPGASEIRPLSDLSNVIAGEAGTTHITKIPQVGQSSQQLAGPANQEFAGVAQALAQVIVTPTSRNRVRPTSDFEKRSTADTMSMLMLQAAGSAMTTADLKAYTQYEFLRASGPQPAASSVPQGLSPSTMLKAYNLQNANKGSGVIAIVDAFHYPQAKPDLDHFSQQFGLPVLPICPPGDTLPAQPCLKIEAQSGVSINCGWAGEAALDLQWAHAIAPNASLVFVEAKSSSYADLFAAVGVAVADVAKFGGGQISMSWGGGEFPSETQTDSNVFVDGALYFASSGDVGGQVIYPAASPRVIAVGGTVLYLDPTGNRTAPEVGWSDSGGGTSSYENLPTYQAGVENITVNRRNNQTFRLTPAPIQAFRFGSARP